MNKYTQPDLLVDSLLPRLVASFGYLENRMSDESQKTWYFRRTKGTSEGFIRLNFETARGAKYGAENEPVPLHRVRAESLRNQGSLEGTSKTV